MSALRAAWSRTDWDHVTEPVASAAVWRLTRPSHRYFAQLTLQPPLRRLLLALASFTVSLRSLAVCLLKGGVATLS